MNNNNMKDTASYTNIKYKTNRLSETKSTQSKLTFFKKIANIFICIEKILIWIVKKIYSILSSCSIITQFIIILLPFSILCIVLIFLVHIYFYQNLFLFNFYKGMKEEFLDNYITEMDDLNSDLVGFVTKETYLDIEDHLFFDVYYKELSSIGLLDNPNKKIFPDINKVSETIYTKIDEHIEEAGGRYVYTMPKESAMKNIDDRNSIEGNSLGELAKIYFHMYPIMNYGARHTNIHMNETFLIAYEFDKNDANKSIINNELFFMFPRKKDIFNEKDHFTPENILINPLVSKGEFFHTEKKGNSYYKENWFTEQDYRFRQFDRLSEEGFIDINFAHLNQENNGYINKSLIITSQQYIQSKNRHYIINIIFFLKESIDNNPNENEYSTFIIRGNPKLDKNLNERYSDNETYVILKSDMTEYSLASIDSEYFHYGLIDKSYSFSKNGISFDTFNLDYLYNPLDHYSTVNHFDVDLKYLSSLYLYKSLFQSAHYSYIQKNREEVYLYNFNDEKVKSICSSINFKAYENYLDETGIDCWGKENSIYYNEENYLSLSMLDLYSIYPYCGCLPLFCLNNYQELKDKNKFNSIELSPKINLPNKCQNYYINYISQDSGYSNEINLTSSAGILSDFKSILDNSNYEYIKFKYENLTQLPEYFFLVVTIVKSTNGLYMYQFYAFVILLEIMILVIGVTLLGSLICMIIMYINLRRFSLIIKKFRKKYELFVFTTENEKIINLNKNENIKNYEQNSNEHNSLLQNDNMLGKEIYNINENNLLDDLFSMFCSHYKYSRKNIEEYFSQRKHETKNQMKLNWMMEKNELFKLLSMFSMLAPIFKLNLTLDYKMYNYSKIIKKYDKYIIQITNNNRQQNRLTQNILYELLSTENLSDYGLVTNLNFKYVSNIKAGIKENSIQYVLFKNVLNKYKGKNEDLNENEINIKDMYLILNDEDKQNTNLILKQKNELMELFKNKFESDDYININKIESSFNFFLINSYYKYLKQITSEENIN